LYAEQIARTDLKVSFWKGFNGKLRNCWYDIQAPGNRCWTTLELAFSYQGSTHTDPQGKRSPFDPEIMEEWDIALIDFFKGQALNRFLSGWLDNVSFISE
jgi:hypothetical protein